MEKYAKYAGLAKDPELKALLKNFISRSRNTMILWARFFPAPFLIVTATTMPARTIHQKPPTTI